MSPYEFLSDLLVTEFGVPADRIVPEAPFASLGLDSLSTVELVEEIEEEFGIVLSDRQATFETLGEAAALIESLVQSDRV